MNCEKARRPRDRAASISGLSIERAAAAFLISNPRRFRMPGRADCRDGNGRARILHSGCAQRSLFERADESGSAPKDPVGVRAETRARWPLDGERRVTRFPDARTRTGPALRGAVRSRNIERVLRTVLRCSLAARQRTHERCFRPARVLLWESAHDQRPPSPPPQIRRCLCTDADGPLRRARGSERMRQHASVAVPKDGGLLSRLQRTAGLLRVPSDEERL